MLPKPEKIKKTAASGEQLDLVDSLSLEKKTKHKRRFVSIFLLLTVGLSIGFWAYHGIKNLDTKNLFSGIKFSTPHFDLNIPKTVNQNNLSKNIDALIPTDSNTWSVLVYTVNNSKTFTYQKNNNTDPNTLINDLSASPTASQSSLISILPQGTKIQENIQNNSNDYLQESLITVPQQKILFVFKITGSNLDKSKSLIPSTIEKIYWQIMESNQ